MEEKSKATCFVVGRTADAFPDLIREIKNRGHEVAAHSYYHAPLTKLSQEEFRADLEKNLEALNKCGCGNIIGYRAPTFSLVESVQWHIRSLLHVESNTLPLFYQPKILFMAGKILERKDISMGSMKSHYIPVGFL